MEEKNTAAIAVMGNEAPISPFTSVATFETAQRMAIMLSNSTLVPEPYQGQKGIANCVIALEMANRVGVSPFLIMQNMHVIQGRPSMSSQYLIAMINASGKFSPLRWKIEKNPPKKFTYKESAGWDSAAKKKIYRDAVIELPDWRYVACAIELASGEMLEGPEVTTEMAVRELWYTKDGSKWQSMPDLMFRYRSAAFFSRMYAPEMAMGLRTVEEAEEMPPRAEVKKIDAVERAENLTERFAGHKESEAQKASCEETEEVIEVTTKVEHAEPLREQPVAEQVRAQMSEPQREKTKQAPRQERQQAAQATMDFTAPTADAFDIPLSSDDGDPF